MKLAKLYLQNIKTYYPEANISFEDNINIFVGPNAGGKSNLFEIIQGVISNIVFYHITLNNNDEWSRPDIVVRKPYRLTHDNVDHTNLQSNILDSHLRHPTEPTLLRMTFLVSENDVKLIENIISQKTEIIKFLQNKVSDSDTIINLLRNYSSTDNFRSFVGREIVVEVTPPNGIHVCAVGCTDEEFSVLDRLFRLLQYTNVFHELSIVMPDLGSYPMFRYFSPLRNINIPQSNRLIDLSTIGNHEESFAKGINQNKETSVSLLDSALLKICYLYRTKEGKGVLKKYNDYLLRFLKVQLSVKPAPHANRIAYEVIHTQISDLPMKLSSGEKEFFNLISGLILTGIKDGIVLLDEPELHLHSQWQSTILKLLEELSSDFNIQFFIVTHSPKFITEETLPYIHRVHKDPTLLTSSVVKPSNPLASNDLKDIVQFINTANNEKAFFANKVILVEGISDLIFFTEIIKKLKINTKSQQEIEIIEVGTKDNLIRFRRLLNEWEIENLIIADLDYLKEVKRPSLGIVNDPELNQRIASLSSQIDDLVAFSKDKLKDILCRKPGRDSHKLIDIILQRSDLSSRVFNKKVKEHLDYIFEDRALAVNSSVRMSRDLSLLLDEIADREKVVILKAGALESIFPQLASNSENKISNALEQSKAFNSTTLPVYLAKVLRGFIK